MPLEYVFKAMFIFSSLSSIIALMILARDSLSSISTDVVIQILEQEEIEFNEAVQKLPDNVIQLNMLCRTDPYKDFVEEFLIFETVRNHKGMFDYVTNRTRMIRKARRLLGQ